MTRERTGSAPRDVLLRGGRILDPARGVDEVGDVLLRGGSVEAQGRSLSAPDDAEVLDCAGAIIAPGFIDVHCHLREPGRDTSPACRCSPP